MDPLGKPKSAALETEQRLLTKAGNILDQAEEIVRERQRKQNQHAGPLDLAAITWSCEVCGCVNPLATISSCKECGC